MIVCTARTAYLYTIGIQVQELVFGIHLLSDGYLHQLLVGQ